MAGENDAASKTEEPTQRKLDEAKRKGDVAKTMEAPQALSLAAAAAVLIGGGGILTQQLAMNLLPFIARPESISLQGTGAVTVYMAAAAAAAPLLLVMFAASSLAGVAGNLLQHGFLLTGERLKPDWKKVNPLSGFKRIFGPDGLAEFLKTFVKLCVVALVCWAVLQPHAREMDGLAALSPAALLPFTRDLFIGLIGGVVAALAVGAGIDFLWQRHRWMQRQRMTKEEVKEDYKQSEGDPHVKARQKQIRAERSRRRMMAQVQTATVVVMNPTHYAVALKYEPGEHAAPVCVAKGVDALALKIRATAEEAGVPVVEDPPLARALHKAVNLDQAIPREHFEAVAKVIGFVMNRSRPRAARAPSGGAMLGS